MEMCRSVCEVNLSIKSLLFNRAVGVGTLTFSGLYSSVLHLDLILPSTSSDGDSVFLLSDEAEGRDVRRHHGLSRREQPVWENVCLRAFHIITEGGWEFKPTNLTWISHDISLRHTNVVLGAAALWLHSGGFVWLRNQPWTIRFEIVIRVFKGTLDWRKTNASSIILCGTSDGRITDWLRNNKYFINYSRRHVGFNVSKQVKHGVCRLQGLIRT